MSRGLDQPSVRPLAVNPNVRGDDMRAVAPVHHIVVHLALVLVVHRHTNDGVLRERLELGDEFGNGHCFLCV
jgi:hypothetical protein